MAKKSKGWMKFRQCAACGTKPANFWTLVKAFCCEGCKHASFALTAQIFWDAVTEYQESCQEKEAGTKASEEKEKSSSSSKSTSESKSAEAGSPGKEPTSPMSSAFQDAGQKSSGKSGPISEQPSSKR